MQEPEATWIYAVVPRESAGSIPAPVGVAGERVRSVRHGGMCAVVGSVPAGQVDEASLRRNLADATWLEWAVRRHHEVVAALSRATPTVPFRLATVYRDDQRVREMLRDRRAELAGALATVTGCTEWGVQALATGPARTTGDRGDPERPGMSYLLHRKAQQAAREESRQAAADAAVEIHQALEKLAAAWRRSPPGRLPAGQRGQVVLNACYLVADGRRDEFTATARGLASPRPALQLRITGPWPAYSFVEVGKEDRT